MLENEGVALRAIRWSEIFPWLSIGKSFRLAISPRLVVFGAAALFLTLLAWWMVASFFCILTHSDAQPPWPVVDAGVPNCPFDRFSLFTAKFNHRNGRGDRPGGSRGRPHC